VSKIGFGMIICLSVGVLDPEHHAFLMMCFNVSESKPFRKIHSGIWYLILFQPRMVVLVVEHIIKCRIKSKMEVIILQF